MQSIINRSHQVPTNVDTNSRPSSYFLQLYSFYIASSFLDLNHKISELIPGLKIPGTYCIHPDISHSSLPEMQYGILSLLRSKFSLTFTSFYGFKRS